ncbi:MULTISPECIES: D-alanyl-D-alanine carboxypeptidase [Streptomyces]|uniref:D-alanyl-D-alanine carboxypeptidase family protein n=1 Tax=Streptomyces TaxID=1883 RepID=UPI0031D370DC
MKQPDAEAGATGDGHKNGDEGGRKDAPKDGHKDGHKDGDARLKKAVEAWVSGSDEAADDDAPSEEAAEGVPADRATAVFRAVRPKADEVVADGKPAERPETDGSAKDAGGDADADSQDGKAAAKPAEDETPAADKSAAGEQKAPADRATAVFRTVSPKADDKDATGEDADKDAAGKDEAPVDRATAVFRAVRPKADEAEAADEAKGDSGAQTAETAENAEEKPSADQPTAVFGALRPKAGDAAGKGKDDKVEGANEKKPSADQPTAVFRAVKPKADAIEEPTELLKAPEPQGEGGAAKSRFVPLKKDDEAPAKPAAPKAAKPAAAPAPAKPAPAKPAAAPEQPKQPEQAPKASIPPAAGMPRPGAVPAAGEQAAPPAAPLDLLAQLTNTPPPPQTPLRTAVRRVKIWTPLVLLLLIVFCVVQAFRPLPDPRLALGAKKSYSFEGGSASFVWPDEGQSAAKVVGAGDVGTYGPQKPVPTASVAKVMTAYVILQGHPLQKGDKTSNKITIDEAAEKESSAEGESTAKVRAGQEFSEYDMLRMLLIPSGNNIARQLARWDAGGSEEAFVKKMNDAAKQLGMTNTTYTDPSGLTATTKSTAVDQVKLAEVMIKNPVVREITQQPNADIPGGPHINNNNDSLLVKGTGVLGIKTGSSSAAGGALMWAARRMLDGKEYLIVGATMDQHFKGLDPNAENSLTKVKNKSYEQLTSIQKALTTATVVKKGDVVGTVDDGLGGSTPVVATKDVVAVGWAGFQAKFALSDGGRKIPHQAKAGTEVGELTVGSGPDAVKVPVALKTALAEPSFGSKLTRLG